MRYSHDHYLLFKIKYSFSIKEMSEIINLKIYAVLFFF